MILNHVLKFFYSRDFRLAGSLSIKLSLRIWASNYDTIVKPMVLLQKRIIRIIVGDKYYAHTNHRFKQLGILKFQQINRYLIGIFMYKAINKLLPIMFQNFFVRRDEEHDHYTRASGNLSVQYARTNYRRFSLFCK